MLAEADYTCVATEIGSLWCFGSAFGNKFDGGLGGPVPTEVPSGFGADDLAIGHLSICRLLGPEVYCWGGAYGGGSAIASAEPFASLSHGSPTCALTAAGSVRCWGDNYAGQLGDGTNTPSELPVAPVGIPEPIDWVDAHPSRVFAIGISGTLYAWGFNGPAGYPGVGDTAERLVPTEVPNRPPLRSVDVGAEHTCGVTPDGAVFCWGLGSDGQLGDGSSSSSTTPVRVAFDTPVHHVATGSDRTCLLTESHEVYCFGYAFLGDGLDGPSPIPVRVNFPWELPDVSDAAD